MRVLCFEGIVENGIVRLPADVTIPNGTKVYIVVPAEPDVDIRTIRISSPCLANPEQASKLIMEVTNINEDQRPKT